MSSWSGAIERSTNLVELEAIVQRGKETYIEVGLALGRIRHAELYKSTHSSWEAYCRQRWGWTPQRAHQLMSGAGVVASTAVDARLIPTERHARELGRVAPEDRAGVIAEAQQEILPGEIPTSDQIRAVIERRVDGKAKAPSLQTRRTPRWFFEALQAQLGLTFALDAYAEPHNALCERFYTRETDGNAQLWEDATFGNPEFDDMAAPLEKAVKEADERGVRSCIVSPVGCAQRWYHESAIRGTIWVPDQRINFDLPDGTPTDRADRDTIVVTFGREHRNPSWKRGVFRVHRLEVKHLAPAKEGA